MQKDMPVQQLEFVNRMIRQLQGQRVFVMSTSNLLYAAAKRGLEEGFQGCSRRTRCSWGAAAPRVFPSPMISRRLSASSSTPTG